MALNHSNLENYYSINFSLIQHHKYSLSDIEKLMPYERDIYVEMLVTHLKKIEEEKQKG